MVKNVNLILLHETIVSHRFESRYHDDIFWYDQFAVMVLCSLKYKIRSIFKSFNSMLLLFDESKLQHDKCRVLFVFIQIVSKDGPYSGATVTFFLKRK